MSLLSAALVAGAACQDKRPEAGSGKSPSPGAAGGGAAKSDSARLAAASPAGPTAEEERKALETAATHTDALPKRVRKDSVALASMTKVDSTLDKLWPVKMPAPLPGSVFPSRRVVAFYGNPLSKKMGVLGEYPKDSMLAKLDHEVARWAKADPSHPVQPALHLIVTVAQGAPGKNGLYRLQMRDSMVNEIYSWAKAKKGLFFLDVQVGKSTVEAEIQRL
jgi:hypothetical protein